nr:putative ribonuclease H-like domain-containing protein [Tanacetum cinerariifolium]
MESLSPHVVAAAKLLILNPNVFDLWKMRIEQYFLMTDYSLWDVILNGDSPTPTRVVDGVVQAVAPTTTLQRLAKKNELNARGTLLIALLDKHQLKFKIHKDAKSLMKAIEKRYQYEILEKLTIRVENSHSDLEDQSLDDLFNNLKIYEAEVKSSSSTSHTTQSIAFVSSQKTDSTNESVNVVPSVSATSTKPPASILPNVDNLSDAADEEPTNYALMAFTSSSSISSLGFNSEVAYCSKACTKAYATLQSHYDKLTVDLRKSQFDVVSYKTNLESIEARLVVYQQNENVFEDDLKLLKLDVMLRDNDLVELRKKFKKDKKERDELKQTLAKFQTSSRNLSKLLESKITDKNGLGYDDQVFNSTVFDCDELNSSEIDESVPTSPVHDSEIVPNVFNVKPSTTKPTKEMSKSNRPSAPIIED